MLFRSEPFVSAVREIPVEEKNQVDSLLQETVEKEIKDEIGKVNKFYKEEDLYAVLGNVISCLEHISERYFLIFIY